MVTDVVYNGCGTEVRVVVNVEVVYYCCAVCGYSGWGLNFIIEIKAVCHIEIIRYQLIFVDFIVIYVEVSN